MSRSARLRITDHRAVSELVNECRDLGDTAAVWCSHLAHKTAALTDTALGLSGEIDGLDREQPVILGTGEWGWENGFDRRGWEQSLVEFQQDPLYSPVLRRYFARTAAAPGDCLARTDLMSDRGWYHSHHYQQQSRVVGLDHTVWCFTPVPAGGHIGLTVGRPSGGRDFTARERGIVREIQMVIAPLVGRSLARFTEPSPAALSPRVRDVLRCVLDGDSDKQVAARLRLSPHTVNEYVKAIYRHFGVNSRAELLARWVRRGWGRGRW